MCGERTGAVVLWQPSHHPSGCCTLVVVEERPPHIIVKRFGCTTIHKKHYKNASFNHSFIGPFKIQRQINEVTYRLQLPPMYCIHPTFHVSLFKPCSSPTPDQHEPDDHPSTRTRGAVLGGPGRYSRPHAVTAVPPHPSKSSRTQRSGSPRRRVRASGAAPGGGGSVRESQSQSPPPTTITRSPEF